MVLGIGWLVYAGIMAALAVVESEPAVYALFLAYGLFTALTESPQKALVAKFAPKTEEGTSFGWYNLVLGLAALPANLMFGALWQGAGMPVAFGFSAVVGLVAVVLLAACAPLARPARA